MKIEKFDCARLRNDGNLILVAGKRGSGKTFLMSHLSHFLLGRRYYDHIFIFAGTESSRIAYPGVAWPLVDNTNVTVIDLNSWDSKTLMLFNESLHSTNSLLIFDAVFYRKGIFDHLKDTCLNVQERKNDIVLGMCYLMDMPVEIQGSVDFVFMFRERIRSNQLQTHRFYSGTQLKSFDKFVKLHYRCTENAYECMVIDCVGDDIFFYTAPGGSNDSPPARLYIDEKEPISNGELFVCNRHAESPEPNPTLTTHDSVYIEQISEHATILAGPFPGNLAFVVSDSGIKYLCHTDKCERRDSTIRHGAMVTYLETQDLTGAPVMPGPDAFMDETRFGIVEEITPEFAKVAWECHDYYDVQTYKFRKGFCFIRYSMCDLPSKSDPNVDSLV